MALYLPDPGATDALGKRLAAGLASLPGGALVALSGDLGAGKTALARAIIQALGHDGPVVSPTYTLMEPYAVAGRRLCHLDLYRLASPEELDYLGIREIADGRDWLLVEWPERGTGHLPVADLEVTLMYADDGRTAELAAATSTGGTLLQTLVSSTGNGEDSGDI